MAQIVTEDFAQFLFAKASGIKKIPTIFDELRLAMQHAQNPLEQVIQLIAEFHGPWTGSSSNLLSLINSLSSIKNISSYGDFISKSQAAVSLLNTLSQNFPSSIGRINNIVCGNMNVPLLREFVSRCQNIHPMVNNFIQMNIGKFPYFQQISEDVASLGQIVLHHTEIDPMKKFDSNGKTTLKTNSRLRRKTSDKLFKKIDVLTDEVQNFVDVMFTRCQSVENNMGLLHQEYSKEKPISHGHNYAMDVFNAKRGKDAIQPIIANAASRFGPSLTLVDTFFPVRYQISNDVQFYNLVAEGESYIADGLNIPIPREPEIPIATEEKKIEVA